LVGTFDDLYELNPQVTIIYAAALRNEETFKVFLDTCKINRYVVEKIDFKMLPIEEQLGPFYSIKVPIQLYSITKSR